MNYFIFYMFSMILFTTTAIANDLIVGTTSGYTPYVSINAEGEYEGFDIDIAKALTDKLNRRLVIKDFGSMPALILALKQNKADILIWSISITQERQKQMAGYGLLPRGESNIPATTLLRGCDALSWDGRVSLCLPQ